MMNPAGFLFIVATPIGNLNDISARAIQTLSEVALIAAEDTRHSRKLLQHLAIDTPLIALHEHNERADSSKLIDQLLQGKSIALISDAGTPLISDPGYHFVHMARQQGITIIPIPGPCALITALSASGLPTDRFVFEGFLPAKTGARLNRLTELQHESRTLLLYESPHRIIETLQDMQTVFGNNREVVVARELTKVFESIISGKLDSLIQQFTDHPEQQRGEFVVLVKGEEQQEEPLNIEAKRILEVLLAELPLKQAVNLAVKLSSIKKNVLYDIALTLL
jgi:16S rRNA (cytidine1402-2'-O)-methyltransferase